MQEWQHSGDVTLRSLAEKYRLRIRQDECGDPIIPGRRGHLYLDAKPASDGGPSLCLMVTDGPIMLKSRWEALGGKLWLGDKSDYFQDVKITGLPEESIKAAIRMLGIKPRRLMSEAQRASLAKAQESSPLAGQMRRRAVESLGDGQVEE